MLLMRCEKTAEGTGVSSGFIELRVLLYIASWLKEGFYDFFSSDYKKYNSLLNYKS